MNTTEQAAKAEAFRALHRGPRLLLMANAWDAVTARLFEAEGFAAVATTSGGVSWALGYPDGGGAMGRGCRPDRAHCPRSIGAGDRRHRSRLRRHAGGGR